MGIHGTPDLSELLTARIDYIADAAIVSVPSHGWLGSIGVVLEGCVEGQICLEDGFLFRSSHTATFGNELIMRSRMFDL